MTQKQASEILGINQPKISALTHGRLAGFSMERLLYFLTRLDQNIQIVVEQKSKGNTHSGDISVRLLG